ncbi:MAG: M4 family metallopeptidase [Bacteroidales bacterium]|nr:M4 family metallopeptidase [Bacteroidales bacterium]
MKRILFFLVGIFLFANLQAQEVEKLYVGQNGTPNFIKFNTKNKAAALTDAQTVLKTYVFVQSGDEAKKVSSSQDKLGFTHEKYQQYYKGIKVEHGLYSVNKRGSVIESMNGEYVFVKDNFRTSPVLSEDAALQKALQFIGAQKYMWQDAQNEAFAKKTEKAGTYFPKGELVIVQDFMGKTKEDYLKPVLAYKFDIYAEKPLSRDFVYVDAITGKIVHKNQIIKHCFDFTHEHSAKNIVKTHKKEYSINADASGSAATRYSGTRTITADSFNGSYRLRETGRGNGIETYDMNTGTNYSNAVDFTDNDNNWTAAEFDNTAKDNAALDAHWGAEMTYDYWLQKHNRNSYDNNGAAIKSYVHYDVAYDNAFWNGSVMTYGDGSDTYFDALTSLDVAAHEIGHAVCTNTANLTYSYESGAMNEGYSDIWGACVEYFAAPEKSTWLIGEDIERRAGYAALRSMSDPKSLGQPDTYQGTNWATGTADNGGVHTNSGVLNHWFYILTIGKTGTNDNGNAYSVTGIGIDKAAAIAYRLESVYLSANSQYADARTFAIQAAEDLYGVGSNEVIQTTNAWYAVGVGAEYGSVTYCTSKGNNSSYEWIAGVTIGAFTNTSGAAGYTDFTSQTVDLTSGQSYAISLDPGFASTAYNEYWKIWIDFNKDGDFADAGELVFDAGALSNTTVTGSINIPTVAAVVTRMRVSMKYNAAQTECEAFSYGEVEDYTVNITAGTADTQAPTAPSNLTSANVTETSVDLSWTASTDNVGVTGYDVYKNGVLYSSVTGTTVGVTGLTGSTNYSFYVKAKDAAGNVSAASNTVNVTTSAPAGGGGIPTGYCASQGNNSNYEWIDLVQLGTINNTSGNDGGYKDNTNLSTNLSAGTQYTVYISAGFSGSSYTEYWQVWIDYNRDGDFADAGELVVSGSSSSSATLSGTFTVPTTISAGTTKMRVTMKYNSAATSCETFSYGEVEDYAVNLSTTAFAGNTFNGIINANELGNEAASYTIYPVPATNYLNIEVPAETDLGITIYNSLGAVVKTEILSGINQINISDLPAGTYTLKLDDGNKQTLKKFIKK